MKFDIEKDFFIFDEFFIIRPEITPENLKTELKNYYLPYIKKLIALKVKKSLREGLIVGVSAIQGAGKTTQGEILEIILKQLGYSTVSLSIDDHYITHQQLVDLRNKDPRFIRRGVTHDISLALKDLKNLQEMGDKPILISGYDKGAHQGDGDRFRWVNPEDDLVINAKVTEGNLVINKQIKQAKVLQVISVIYKGQNLNLPENMGSDIPLINHFLPGELCNFLINQGNSHITITKQPDNNIQFSSGSQIILSLKDLPNGWRLVIKKPDFIFYDGWMLGARQLQNESVFEQNLPALETEEAKQFAKDLNKKLADYLPLWQKLEFLNVLYVPNYHMALTWRDQAEEVLRSKGEGMSKEEIKEFVYYFWRSIHPAIHIKNLATDPIHTNQVVIINDDHSVKEVLTPEEVKIKYL